MIHAIHLLAHFFAVNGPEHFRHLIHGTGVPFHPHHHHGAWTTGTGAAFSA